MLEAALLLFIISILLKFGRHIVKLHADDWAKINNKSANGLTWVDSNGKMRLTSNNHLCIYITLPNGDRVLQDIKTGESIVNYTQNERVKLVAKSKQIAEQKGESIYCIDFNPHKEDSVRGVVGMHFYNPETKDTFVIRTFDYIPFYVNIQTGEIGDVVDKKMVGDNDIQEIKNKMIKHQQKNSHIKARFFFNSYWHYSTDLYYSRQFDKI